MATYYASRVSSSNTSIVTSPPARYKNDALVSQVAEFTVGTALAATDVIQLFTVPKGATVLDIYVSSSGTQSGSDSVFTLGDGNVTDRYITVAGGLALRTGGAISRMNAHTGTGYVYPDEDTIDLLMTTTGTGQTTSGVIRATVLYAPER